VASFFARALAGPVDPDEAGERAAACVVERPANPTYGFGALAIGAAEPRIAPRETAPNLYD
jgi:hypothetical protein